MCDLSSAIAAPRWKLKSPCGGLGIVALAQHAIFKIRSPEKPNRPIALPSVVAKHKIWIARSPNAAKPS